MMLLLRRAGLRVRSVRKFSSALDEKVVCLRDSQMGSNMGFNRSLKTTQDALNSSSTDWKYRGLWEVGKGEDSDGGSFTSPFSPTAVRNQVQNSVLAMYSSPLGAIITDPALMSVPVDDHGFHRGHAVFDTCNVLDGHAYGLEMHINRLLSSAKLAHIPVTDSSSKELEDIILATLAAAGRENGVFCRYWMTVGRGDFHVSPKGCIGGHSFYVVGWGVVHETWARDEEKAVKEAVVSTPLKPKLLANMKSNNYMINALTAMEAEEKGGNLGFQVDAEGYLQEASISCVGIVEEDGCMRTPPFDSILASTTVKRRVNSKDTIILPLPVRPYHHPMLIGVSNVVYKAKEVFLLGGHHVVPVGCVGDVVIGDGSRGPVCKRLQEMQHSDMKNPDMIHRIPFELYN
eukprot:jgi/Bigna1/77442/fgenesh1_pg.48_\